MIEEVNCSESPWLLERPGMNAIDYGPYVFLDAEIFQKIEEALFLGKCYLPMRPITSVIIFFIGFSTMETTLAVNNLCYAVRMPCRFRRQPQRMESHSPSSPQPFSKTRY